MIDDQNKITEEINTLKETIIESGKTIFKLSNGNLFPCHILFISTLNRVIEIIDGFMTLAEAKNYSCCMILTRIQLDNILRFYGVLKTENPHITANEMYNGTQLNKLKDKDGNKLTDGYLVDSLSKSNEWVKHVYKLTSGYVHLSNHHIYNLLDKSELQNDGFRSIFVGSVSDHIEEKQWIELLNGFKVITKGFLEVYREWEIISKLFDETSLKQIFPPLDA
jgi:hypothetical protein